jgi:hypothetical protein
VDSRITQLAFIGDIRDATVTTAQADQNVDSSVYGFDSIGFISVRVGRTGFQTGFPIYHPASFLVISETKSETASSAVHGLSSRRIALQNVETIV